MTKVVANPSEGITVQNLTKSIFCNSSYWLAKSELPHLTERYYLSFVKSFLLVNTNSY